MSNACMPLACGRPCSKTDRMGSVRRRGDRVRVSLEAGEVALVLSLTAQVLDLLGAPSGEASPDGAKDTLPDGAKDTLPDGAKDTLPDGGKDTLPDGTKDALEDLLEESLEPVETPEDPVLLRLLPDAYRGDGEAAGEFRRLTEADLRATKRSGLSQIVADLSSTGSVQRGGGVRLDLDESAAAAWLPALTDIRLALGTRIGVTEEMDEERLNLPVDSPRYAEIATYDWMSWLQDAMVRALTEG
jgi:hypothetical protein